MINLIAVYMDSEIFLFTKVRIALAQFCLTSTSLLEYYYKHNMLVPKENYKNNEFVPNVCSPCADLTDTDTVRIAIYYDTSDKYAYLLLQIELYIYIL